MAQKSYVKRQNETTPLAFLLAGVVVGAGLAYFFDPHQGKRRRIRVVDQFVSKIHRLENWTNRTVFKVKAKVIGKWTMMQNRKVLETVSDETLNKRVRSAFGRVISHPKAIMTSVDNGVVTLTGSILRKENSRLLRTVKSVPGVLGVVSYLDLFIDTFGISELQGSGPKYLN